MQRGPFIIASTYNNAGFSPFTEIGLLTITSSIGLVFERIIIFSLYSQYSIYINTMTEKPPEWDKNNF